MEIYNNKESKLELPHNEVRPRKSHIRSNKQQGMGGLERELAREQCNLVCWISLGWEDICSVIRIHNIMVFKRFLWTSSNEYVVNPLSMNENRCKYLV